MRRSGPPITYDLDDGGDRARLDEQVLGEGGDDDDVRSSIDGEQLRHLWEELMMPSTVGCAWAGWLGRHPYGS